MPILFLPYHVPLRSTSAFCHTGDPTAEWQNHENQTLGNASLSLGYSLYLLWTNAKAIVLEENIYIFVILTNSKLLLLALPKPTVG